jgi:hypothetical protein
MTTRLACRTALSFAPNRDLPANRSKSPATLDLSANADFETADFETDRQKALSHNQASLNRPHPWEKDL